MHMFNIFKCCKFRKIIFSILIREVLNSKNLLKIDCENYVLINTLNELIFVNSIIFMLFSFITY